MNKIINFLIDIKMTKECTYIHLFKLFLIGIAARHTGVSKATSLTIGFYRLHFTWIIALDDNNVMSTNHGIS
jgi:hypothetical protein